MNIRRIFTKKQLERLANIFDNFGQVMVASIALPGLLRIDKIDGSVIAFGLALTLVAWWISLHLGRISS